MRKLKTKSIRERASASKITRDAKMLTSASIIIVILSTTVLRKYLPVSAREIKLITFSFPIDHKVLKWPENTVEFSKANSVFAEWREDTKDIVKGCIKNDFEMWKIHKIVVD